MYSKMLWSFHALLEQKLACSTYFFLEQKLWCFTYFGKITVAFDPGLDGSLSDITESTVPGRYKRDTSINMLNTRQDLMN
jgi:hypothetical protein